MIRWNQEDYGMKNYITMQTHELEVKMDNIMQDMNGLTNQRQIDQASRYITHILFELDCRQYEEC